METMLMILLAISWIMSMGLAFLGGFAVHASMINRMISGYADIAKSAFSKLFKGGGS